MKQLVKHTQNSYVAKPFIFKKNTIRKCFAPFDILENLFWNFIKMVYQQIWQRSFKLSKYNNIKSTYLLN